MLDVSHLARNPQIDMKTIVGNSAAAGVTWQAWTKPRGKSMAFILLFGSGGAGGTGVIGANSTAAGGGGGGSASQSRLIVPLALLPDILYVSCGVGVQGAGIASYVSIRPDNTVNHLLLHSSGGGVGGNASGATAGVFGPAGAVSTLALAPLAGLGIPEYIIGNVGIAGGAAIAGAALTLPTTSLVVTGGTGGGGLPAAAAAGTAGGTFTTPAAPSPFPAFAAPAGTSTATVPPSVGPSGFNSFNGLFYSYGGIGGGSTHGTATGAGLVQAAGGKGGYGSGGGGMGGALTASTAAAQSRGGDGICIIVCW